MALTTTFSLLSHCDPQTLDCCTPRGLSSVEPCSTTLLIWQRLCISRQHFLNVSMSCWLVTKFVSVGGTSFAQSVLCGGRRTADLARPPGTHRAASTHAYRFYALESRCAYPIWLQYRSGRIHSHLPALAATFGDSLHCCCPLSCNRNDVQRHHDPHMHASNAVHSHSLMLESVVWLHEHLAISRRYSEPPDEHSARPIGGEGAAATLSAASCFAAALCQNSCGNPQLTVHPRGRTSVGYRLRRSYNSYD
jgi:hypothetical protein